MASRLFFPFIVLITRFCVECNTGIRIETFKGDVFEGSQLIYKKVGANIFYGDVKANSHEHKFFGFRSGFAFSKKDSQVVLLFKAYPHEELTVNLNVAINSGKFESYEDKKKEEFKKIVKNNYGLVFGSWWNSELKIVELYLNFLTNEKPMDLKNILYLKTVVLADEISSALMIREQYEMVIAQQEELKEKEQDSLEKQEEKDNINRKFEDRQTNIYKKDNFEEIPTLLLEANDRGKLIIGNQQCSVNKGLGFKLRFGEIVMDQAGKGEFYMAFYAEKIDKEEAIKAATDFTTSGPTSAIITDLAKVECSKDRIVTFTLVERDKNPESPAKSKVLV